MSWGGIWMLDLLCDPMHNTLPDVFYNVIHYFPTEEHFGKLHSFLYITSWTPWKKLLSLHPRYRGIIKIKQWIVLNSFFREEVEGEQNRVKSTPVKLPSLGKSKHSHSKMKHMVKTHSNDFKFPEM